MKHALTPFFFYAFAAMSVLPGIFVLASRDIVRAAFWLLAALSGFAGLYVLLGADFLAITQVVVYLGGIMILILFGVMLTHRDPALVRRARRLNLLVPGLAGGAVLAAAGAAAMTRGHFAVPAVAITQIKPAAGSIAGGTRLEIRGENLAEITAVTLGGAALLNLDVKPTLITGITPAHGSGAVALALVSTATGGVSAPGAFTYGGHGTEDAWTPVHASRTLPLPHEQFTGTTKDVGTLLVASPDGQRSFLLPFEIASVLLLAALVGAAYLARRGGDPVEPLPGPHGGPGVES